MVSLTSEKVNRPKGLFELAVGTASPLSHGADLAIETLSGPLQLFDPPFPAPDVERRDEGEQSPDVPHMKELVDSPSN